MQKKRVPTIFITRALTEKILTHHCVIQSTVNSEVLVNSFLVDTVKLKTTEDGLKSRIFHVSKKSTHSKVLSRVICSSPETR